MGSERNESMIPGCLGSDHPRFAEAAKYTIDHATQICTAQFDSGFSFNFWTCQLFERIGFMNYIVKSLKPQAASFFINLHEYLNISVLFVILMLE
jgi:hypothetical protein